MQIDPNKDEILVAEWLQSLFNFETTISYMISNYSKDQNDTARRCIINISATGEKIMACRSRDTYNRGPNSIKLLKFAWQKLPKGENQWYDGCNGFYIPYNKLIKLQLKLKQDA